MNMNQVTESLKAEMAKMSDEQLLNLANEMGVDLREWQAPGLNNSPALDRAEVESALLAAEQYAFTH